MDYRDNLPGDPGNGLSASHSATAHPSAPAHSIVLTSCAGDRLDAARSWFAALPACTETLIIGASLEAADEFVRGSAVTCGSRFGVHRLTLNLMAGLLAADVLATAGLVPIGGFAAEAVTARVIHRLGLEHRLRYFEPVGERPGLPGAIARTLDELRMANIEPAEVEALDNAGPALAEIMREFESELLRARLADRAGVFRAAVAAAREIPWRRFMGLPACLLDPVVGSIMERDLVAALAASAPTIIAVLPEGDFRGRTLLEQALGVKAREIASGVEPSAEAARRSINRLQKYLFAEHTAAPAPLDETVGLLSAPGEARECVEIARQIHLEAARGTPFDRIAILLNAPAQYVPQLEEALRRAEIPAHFASDIRRPEPGGRALLVLLACAAERLSARRYAEYLSLAQVPERTRDESEPTETFVPVELELVAAALGAGCAAVSTALDTPGGGNGMANSGRNPDDPIPVVDGDLRAPWRWEKLLIDASVIGNSVARWERRLRGFENDLRLKLSEQTENSPRALAIKRQILDLEHLRDVTLPHIRTLAEMPHSAPWGEWLGHLRKLVHLAIRDQEPVFAALAELEPMTPIGPVDLDEVRLVLANRLGELSFRPARRRYGAVFVASTGAARGLDFDRVFAPGLAEKLFPKKLAEDAILPDRLRCRLGERIARQEDRIAAERLALRLAAGAARRRITFSYPRLDISQGRARVPSFYALEVLRAAEGRLPSFEEFKQRAASVSEMRLGWPAPADAAQAIDNAEFDLALLDHLLAADPRTGAGTANYLLSANEHLARALRSRARRWLRRWTSADGLVDPEPYIQAGLARHRFANRSYSATSLQNYAACPYRFFLQAIHRLEPREDPRPIEAIDPLTRGALFHEVQFELLSALRRNALIPVTAENLSAAQDLLEEFVRSIAATRRDELAPAIERIWEEGITLIRADLREWLRRLAEETQDWLPARFELSFGLSEREQADPASTSDPVAIANGFLLRGSIDLVECGPLGLVRVTDHKTGKAWAGKGVQVGGGEILQPLLYALAAEKLLAEPVESGRLYYCTSAGGYQERVVMLDETARSVVGQVLAIIGDAIEQGFLPAAPAPGKCARCDYLLVCGPREEHRTARKPAGRLAALRRLRAMR